MLINHDNDDQYEQQGRRGMRCAYIKYRISIRPDTFNAFLLGRRLFQQWIVDSYVKVEGDRIEYIRNNQKQLRVESYQGLLDHLNHTANNENFQVGKMVILPSIFVGVCSCTCCGISKARFTTRPYFGYLKGWVQVDNRSRYRQIYFC